MKRKNIHLFAFIMAALVFIGFMGESGPKEFFGFSVSIWAFRIAWLVISISFLMTYLKAPNSAKEE